MATLRADRYLHVTADRSRVVEEDDVDGAWLLVSPGSLIGEGDVQRYGMYVSGGRVRYDGCPRLPGDPAEPAPASKQVAKPEDKMAARPEDKSADAAEWSLKTEPAEYLERYPDGRHAELARQILAAESDGES